MYIALEYKSEHIATAEDARRKEELGNIWEEVSGGRCRFWMVTRENGHSVLGHMRAM